MAGDGIEQSRTIQSKFRCTCGCAQRDLYYAKPLTCIHMYTTWAFLTYIAPRLGCPAGCLSMRSHALGSYRTANLYHCEGG